MSAVPSGWNWRTRPDAGIWSHGAAWARPFAAAAPWLSLALIAALTALVANRVTAAPGTVFDLPGAEARETVDPGLTAYALPVPREAGGGEETILFFDDARFVPADAASAETFCHRLSERARDANTRHLLLLADRRVSAGDLMLLMSLARKAGLQNVQIAEKRD